MGCGVGCRHSSDPTLLWLWHRLAAAVLIGPLAWELPYAAGVTLEKKKRKRKKKKNPPCDQLIFLSSSSRLTEEFRPVTHSLLFPAHRSLNGDSPLLWQCPVPTTGLAASWGKVHGPLLWMALGSGLALTEA